MRKIRREWNDLDNQRLIDLWRKTGSIILISLLMERTVPSVQTQASRIGLPQRNESRDNHRRRWRQVDDERLNQTIASLTDQDGMIPIEHVSEKMGRSVDAVVARLVTLHGTQSEIVRRLKVDDTPVAIGAAAVPSMPKTAAPTRNGEGPRDCLRCRKSFWSEGRHNRVCGPCRQLNNEEIDWQF